IGRRHVEPPAGDQDVIPAAPSGDPCNVHALTDRTHKVLTRRVGNVELALIEREQRRGAVAKVLDFVFQSVLRFDAWQNAPHRAECGNLDAVETRVIPTGISRRAPADTDRRHRKERKPEGTPCNPRCRHTVLLVDHTHRSLPHTDELCLSYVGIDAIAVPSVLAVTNSRKPAKSLSKFKRTSQRASPRSPVPLTSRASSPLAHRPVSRLGRGLIGCEAGDTSSYDAAKYYSCGGVVRAGGDYRAFIGSAGCAPSHNFSA